MKTSTKHVLLALSFTALLGSCSRPTATFQPSHAQRYYSPQPAVTAQAPATEAIAATAPVAEAAPVTTTTPAATKADIENVLVKAEAMASTKATASESRKLNRRIAKIREVLAKAPLAAPTTTTTTKKASLVQRMMLKRMDSKMKQQLAPEQPMRTSTLTAGLVIGLIGLLLLVLSVANPLGLILLVVGIVLVILGLLQ
ncbi:hypothetical protein [Fibrella aquatilis]|uniref:Uncharacterized protein n=1 Tax=Fibrella aquatilis TaxID=2817059 RepID=A0A939G3D3_9BACT|nr:hypothetical protein [Fibrella aquatilis]MBO0929522.1 hypothetical protein [Fibrella aquatilis]